MTIRLTAFDFFMLMLGWTCLLHFVDAATRHVSQCRLCHHCRLGGTPSDDPSGISPDDSDFGAVSVIGAGSTTASSTTDVVVPSALHRSFVKTLARTLSQASDDAEVRSSGGSGATAHRSKRRVPVYDPERDPTVPIQFKPSSYRPRRRTEMASLPVCEECYGCHHNLTLMTEKTFLNTTYTSEIGATTSWIFRTQTNMTPSGEAVVKVYCVPLVKGTGFKLPVCSPVRIADLMKLLMALDKLSQDCGFLDLIPRVWLAPVLGVLPGVGYPIDWWGLWMEYVEGVSLENFLYRGIPRPLPLDTIADMFNNRLNKTRVVRAAIFDLLTSQCDRHAQNLFLQEDGNLKLIDNESCLQHMWRSCGFDSVLVPTTQKQEIVRLGNDYVAKLPTLTGQPQVPRFEADPLLLLDYRCYLPEGQEQMGTQYPPQIDKCLRRIASMTPKEVATFYGFPDLVTAMNLRFRATDMITRGYEWAAKYGHPQNAPPKRYRFQPKCCSLRVDGTGFVCGHAWKPSYELPLGNPFTGMEWDTDRPDPGTYSGGTFPEDGDMVVNVTDIDPITGRRWRWTRRHVVKRFQTPPPVTASMREGLLEGLA
ncbi:hypothetical protein Vretimale_16715 [Volvox reticuliferus]|uniref:PI3K/PI4K catalytic domain-containing protein n=1 Tax=Volvox reticuliferus TaxID=1737510 RepID=A0A8J4FPK6_9CHLO|nr:hypothetical protein Vretifemale_8553 [Volvox reticuliferus]GIM13646.1 hypothetical protein Vretimale_16715 [Volvox reticuliferus]